MWLETKWLSNAEKRTRWQQQLAWRLRAGLLSVISAETEARASETVARRRTLKSWAPDGDVASDECIRFSNSGECVRQSRSLFVVEAAFLCAN